MAKGRKTGGRVAGTQNKNNAGLRELAQQYTKECVAVLVAITRNPEMPPPARVAAAKEVLDRGHGKAPQALTGADGGALIPTMTRVIHTYTADASENL